MSKKKKMTPELRFPEFENEKEWVEKTLENFIDLFSGIALKSEELSDDKSGIPILRGINITEGYIRHSKDIDKYFLGGLDSLKKYLVKENDIVIGMDGSKVGKNVALIKKEDENSILIQRVARIRTNEKSDINFVYQLFISDRFRRYVDTVNTSSGIPHISAQQIKDFKVGVPPKLREQQQVASCLSSLDKVIAAHSQQLELLKDHKKGLVQNLFPQGDEKVPKYRFNEFVNDGEWNLKPLGDICKLVRGPFGGALKKEIFIKEGYAVYEQSHAIYSDFSSFRYYIDDKKFSELKRFSVKPDDIIMSCSGTMGKFAIVPLDYKNGIINQALLMLTVKKGYNNLFIKITLEAENNQNKLLSQSAGGAIKNVVSVSQIKELGLYIPSFNEQKKIASCLSSLDALITAQAEKIEQLKLHKKGLMQGLFPKIND